MPSALASTSSVMSSASPSRRSSAKLAPITIEDVFATMSEVKAYGNYRPKARPVLTPNSAESCLRCGVDPSELRIRDLDSFWEPNIDPKIQRMRHEDYSQCRHDLMKEVRGVRTKLQNRASKQRGGGLSPKNASPKKATLVDLDAKQLEKVQLRQQKEIEQMLAFEMKQVEIQEAAARRINMDEKRALKKKRMRMKARKRAAEQKKMMDLKRKAEDEIAEKQRRILAQKHFQKEKELERKRLQKEEAIRKEAEQRDLQRQMKAQELAEKTRRIFAAQQENLLQKMREAERKEKKRIMAVERENAFRKKEMDEKRRAIKERIDRNLEACSWEEQERKNRYYMKQRLAEERHAQRARENEIEAEERRRYLIVQEKRRKLILQEKKNEDELRAMHLRSIQDQTDVALKQVRQVREQQQRLKIEQSALKSGARMRNVERQQRKQEYKRMMTLRKLEESEARTRDMLEQREALIKKRREAAINAKRQRDHVKSAMQKIRVHKNWKKGTELLKPLMSPSGKKRPKLKKRKAKKSYAKSKSRHTSHGGYNPLPDDAEKRIEERLRTESVQSGPYISPYESVERRPSPQNTATAVPAFAVVRDDGTLTF